MRNTQIQWPALLIELDTTGVSREDCVIHVACRLVDNSNGSLSVVERYAGFRVTDRPSTPEAFSVHGLSMDGIRGEQVDIPRLRDLVAKAGCFVSRNPKFTAKKLHALVPSCLEKRWYQYPAHIQGFPGIPFPANQRMEVLIGNVESFGYGRRHNLSELLRINADQFTLVFDEDGPPEVSVRFGKRKVISGFADALLKCSVGARFRLHGKEGYDFITGYCHDGPAYREKAFRLANTPSNLELVGDHRRTVYLDRIDGLTFFLAIA